MELLIYGLVGGLWFCLFWLLNKWLYLDQLVFLAGKDSPTVASVFCWMLGWPLMLMALIAAPFAILWDAYFGHARRSGVGKEILKALSDLIR